MYNELEKPFGEDKWLGFLSFVRSSDKWVWDEGFSLKITKRFQEVGRDMNQLCLVCLMYTSLKDVVCSRRQVEFISDGFRQQSVFQETEDKLLGYLVIRTSLHLAYQVHYHLKISSQVNFCKTCKWSFQFHWHSEMSWWEDDGFLVKSRMGMMQVPSSCGVYM